MIGVWLYLGVVAKTPILTYHDIVADASNKKVWFDCTVQEFRSQIAWLRKQGAFFVDSGTVYRSVRDHRALPKKSICITFADNYLGFYKFAWPILKKERIPVTQFVHTGFAGSPVGRPKMTWSQLVELDRSGLCTIASQTVTHPEDLTKMTDVQVLAEFRNSKAQLESKLGHKVDQLAYPNGKFDSRVSKLAKQAGYLAAFSEACREAESAVNLFEIPRYVHTRYREAWNNLNRQ